MGFYQKHVFFCTNQKTNGRKCCQDANAKDMATFAKTYLKQHNCHGEDKIRVSTSGCLGRCMSGPWMVVYPEGQWFNYESEADVVKILASLMDASL